MVRLFIFLLLMGVASETKVYGSEASEKAWIKEAYISFSQGDYLQTLSLLEIAEKKHKSQMGIIHYWRGLSYNRLGEYDQGILYLSSASKSKETKKFRDLYYELGQAFYASEDFKKASRAFMQSLRVSYKPEESLFYVASSLQEAKQYDQSVKVYQKLTKRKNAPIDLVQLAEYQIAEIYLVLVEAKQEKQKSVHEQVLPQFDRAFNIDSKSILAAEINQRYEWLKRKYDITPDEMDNGRVIPEKRFQLQFNQAFSYDSNIIQEADQPDQKATDKTSWLSNSELFMSQVIPIQRRYFLTPKLDAIFLRHFEREVPAIYQNDTLTLGGGAKLSYEHRAYQNPASLFLDFDFDYTEKDILRDKTLRFNNKSYEFNIGEKVRRFKGDTTFKIKYKKNSFYTYLLDTTTLGISIGQVVPIDATQIFILNFISDLNTVEDDTKSNHSHSLRADYLYSSNWKKNKWHFYTTFSVLDTKKQKLTRGTETTFSPGITYGLKFGKIMEGKIDYNYTKNSSQSKSLYAYSKHVISFNLEIGI